MCHIADADVAQTASIQGITRALASVLKAGEKLQGAVVLIGNAPLALAGVARLCIEENIRPSVVIGMPVGFVNVVDLVLHVLHHLFLQRRQAAVLIERGRIGLHQGLECIGA